MIVCACDLFRVIDDHRVFHSVLQSDPNTHVGTEENSQSVILLDLSFTGYIIITTNYFLSFKKLSYKDQNTWSSANPMKLFR